jgi:hypothetical protein
MPRVTIEIGLPPTEGCPDIQIAVLTKTWLCVNKSPFRLSGIPHTNDKCDRLVLVSEGPNDWSISFKCQTEHFYESNTVLIQAFNDLRISCPGRGLDRSPKGNFQWVVEEFAKVLLRNEWTDQSGIFEHLMPK